ncbi:transposase [Sandaracinus amylolyticus]|uniref:transposase n=1 Tax=Sandaracinus amylolyticus TaxID=927083 RepID=UPI0012ED6639|nr:transposase [Sandaracinus amylolyticus]
MAKRTYRTVEIQHVDASKLATALGACCIVAIDLAKTKMFAGFASAAGRCIEIVRFEHPKQTRLFLELLCRLRELGVALEVAMEPTGVYGDALRYQLTLRDIPVFRVDAKKVHDAAALLDGVPSLHDAKACTLLAHLHAQGISKRWKERSAVQRAMRSLIDERDLYARPFETAYGRLEALVARHWPELSQHLDMDAAWHLHLLCEMPGPAEVRARRGDAVALLRRVSRAALSFERIEQIVGCAVSSLGESMHDQERSFLRSLARHMLALREHIRDVDKRIEAELANHRELHSIRAAFGAVTTAALVADLGNPADYESSASFEKAMGLNLRVQSSGNNAGQHTIHITKRGPGRARRYLFLAALRFVQSDPVAREWYRARKGYRADIKLKAVVALMRKLARAMVHVARGAPFDATKLFDTRSMTAVTASPSRDAGQSSLAGS